MKDPGILTVWATPGYKAGKLPENALTLTQLGIGRDDSKQFQKLARMSDQEFEAWLDRPRARNSHRKEPGGGADGEGTIGGTDLLAIPRSIPSTLRELAKLRWDIDKADTYKALRRIERKAEALKKLFAEVDVVRIQASEVIVFANHRIGVELGKLPVAKASGSNQHKKQERVCKGSAPALKEQVGSQKRGLRLNGALRVAAVWTIR